MYNCTFLDVRREYDASGDASADTNDKPVKTFNRVIYIYICISSFNRIRIRNGNKVKNPIRIKIKMVWIRNTLINNKKKSDPVT
jgi:hypothetical protein